MRKHDSEEDGEKRKGRQERSLPRTHEITGAYRYPYCPLTFKNPHGISMHLLCKHDMIQKEPPQKYLTLPSIRPVNPSNPTFTIEAFIPNIVWGLVVSKT